MKTCEHKFIEVADAVVRNDDKGNACPICLRAEVERLTRELEQARRERDDFQRAFETDHRALVARTEEKEFWQSAAERFERERDELQEQLDYDNREETNQQLQLGIARLTDRLAAWRELGEKIDQAHILAGEECDCSICVALAKAREVDRG